MVAASRLNDPCLVALFKQLPPADKLTARKVCSRWADLVTYAARSTRTLAILVGGKSIDPFATIANENSLGRIRVVKLLKKEDGSQMFPLERFTQWNALLFRGLDEATAEEIGATFVNLDTLLLGLYQLSSTELNPIPHLLELLAHQLTTLKLYKRAHRDIDKSTNHLFKAINGLTALKNLHLNLLYLPFYDLPIISQLEQLHVYWTGCSPQQFATLLHQHATANTSLRNVEYLTFVRNSIQHFTPLSDHILTCFTRFGGSRLTNSQQISTHFRHLISLSFEPTAITFRRLFGHLSQLTQLLYLSLEIDFESILRDDEPDVLLPQLKSVKALELHLTILSHRNLEQLKIGWTMPNVEAIDCGHVWQSRCTDCTIREFSAEHVKVSLATFKRCLRQMLTPLKAKCTKLRTIRHNFERFFDWADE